MSQKHANASCPMDQFLRIISGPWTTYILWRLSNEEKLRFGALKRLVPGISSRVLTERLRMLEDHGFVNREYVPTIPPQVSYSLSEQGREMRHVLNEMSRLSIKWGIASDCTPHQEITAK